MADLQTQITQQITIFCQRDIPEAVRSDKEIKMIINLPYDNVETMKAHHMEMKSWNEEMAKQHQEAAIWHEQRAEELEKAMIRVPLEPEQKPAPSAGGARGSSTDGPDPAAPAATTVPLDPVKKADLVSILEDHAAEYGDFDKSIEEIVQLIAGE